VELRGTGFAASNFKDAPTSNSACWRFWDDTVTKHRDGWICDQPAGGENITFHVPLPQKTVDAAYRIRIGFLRSYENVGKVGAVTDERHNVPFY
jgi:hypothetical protein